MKRFSRSEYHHSKVERKLCSPSEKRFAAREKTWKKNYHSPERHFKENVIIPMIPFKKKRKSRGKNIQVPAKRCRRMPHRKIAAGAAKKRREASMGAAAKS